LLRNLNKDQGQKAAYRGAASIAFTAVCRSAYVVAPDPQAPERRILAEQKNNLAPPQPSLAYQLLGPADGAPHVSWLGPSDYTASQLLATSSSALPRPTERDRAKEFLADFLQASPRTSREVWAAAQELDLAERTLNRAKQELEIRSQWQKVDGIPLAFWLLPKQQLPESTPNDPDVPDLEEWLGPLRERFPLPTPLDDL
jgi:hypothetical protein